MSTVLLTLGWGGLLTLIAMWGVVGAYPVLAVQVAVKFYPKEHPRRAELLAETTHVKKMTELPAQWRWIGGLVAASLIEGVPARRAAARRERRVVTRIVTMTHVAGTPLPKPELMSSHEPVKVTFVSPTAGGEDREIEVPFHVALEAVRDDMPEGMQVIVRSRNGGAVRLEPGESTRFRRGSPEPVRHWLGRRRRA